MGLRRQVRNLIIGKDKIIKSHAEYKGIVLSGQFALVGIVLSMVYFVVDLFHNVTNTIFVYVSLSTLMTLCLISHRKGWHRLANYILLVSTSLAVYLMAASEVPETGAFIHFISVTLAGYIILGYKNKYTTTIFAAFVLGLFILAYGFNISVLNFRHYSPDLVAIYRIINFTSALVTCTMGVFLLTRLNYENSIKLLENNRLLSKTNAELDHFVYSASHDLRAPLTSILGLLNIADLSGDPIEIKRYMEMIRNRIDLLDKFIKDITDYSRNNRMAIVKQQINLSTLAQEVWDMLKYTPEARMVTFQLDIPGGVTVESDPGRLKTILINLMSNALRYHDIKKQDKYIRLGYLLNGKGFHVKVEDNGMGIPPRYQSKIFDMFFRAHESSEGSGLGLYIVKETISKLSGTIQVQSVPGVGSTFTVKLPY